jgi:hypothetical protein
MEISMTLRDYYFESVGQYSDNTLSNWIHYLDKGYDITTGELLSLYELMYSLKHPYDCGVLPTSAPRMMVLRVGKALGIYTLYMWWVDYLDRRAN